MLTILTAQSRAETAAEAVLEVIAEIEANAPEEPTLLWVYAEADLDPEALHLALRTKWPDCAIVGGSSCRGAFTDAAGTPVFARLAVLALCDPESSAGTAVASDTAGHRAAAAAATQAAMERSARGYEVPSLVWLCAAPGQEEAALAGIADVVGGRVPVFGGSSADNTVAGGWWQIANDGVAHDGVAVAVLHTDGTVATAFQSGYLPEDRSGTVSEASGRLIKSIDGRPAAATYADWTRQAIAPATLPATVLADATWFPFGRAVGDVEGIPFYLLSHPAEITEDGAIALFSEVPTGSTLHLMCGTRDSLVSRIRRVATDALAAAGDRLDRVRGAMVVYCGGCMLAVSDDMDTVVEHLTEALPGVPLLGLFSFGEQGQALSGEALHGNLMISVVLFVDD